METAGINGSFFRIAPQVGFRETKDFIREFLQQSHKNIYNGSFLNNQIFYGELCHWRANIQLAGL
jgi:hypothetical protein